MYRVRGQGVIGRRNDGAAIRTPRSGRAREASRLASEQMALLDSIGDATLTTGLASWAIAICFDTGEIATILRWSQTVIDLASGDPTKGASFGLGYRWRWRSPPAARPTAAGPSRVA